MVMKLEVYKKVSFFLLGVKKVEYVLFTFLYTFVQSNLQ